MPIWDKLKQELDDAARVTQDALEKAGKAAQDALDEGKLRVDAFRARQTADRDAQAYGYAMFRARRAGTELDTATADRLFNALAEHDAEAARLEAALSVLRNRKDEPPPAAADQQAPAA